MCVCETVCVTSLVRSPYYACHLSMQVTFLFGSPHYSGCSGPVTKVTLMVAFCRMDIFSTVTCLNDQSWRIYNPDKWVFFGLANNF